MRISPCQLWVASNKLVREATSTMKIKAIACRVHKSSGKNGLWWMSASGEYGAKPISSRAEEDSASLVPVGDHDEILGEDRHAIVMFASRSAERLPSADDFALKEFGDMGSLKRARHGANTGGHLGMRGYMEGKDNKACMWGVLV